MSFGDVNLRVAVFELNQQIKDLEEELEKYKKKIAELEQYIEENCKDL